MKKWGIDPFTLGAYAMFTKNQVIDNGKWHGYKLLSYVFAMFTKNQVKIIFLNQTNQTQPDPTKFNKTQQNPAQCLILTNPILTKIT